MKVFAICTCIFCFYLAFDVFFNDEMWDLNTKLTVNLQQNQFSGEKEMFLAFSYSLYVLPILAFIAFFFMNNKLGAVLYGCMIFFSEAANSQLKNVYHQARPFFVERSIQPFECTTQFGKPSGHAMTSSLMCFLLPSILFPEIWKSSEKRNYPIYIRVLVISILFFWTFMTGLSRVFMGVHSFPQIILGWAYSAYIMIIYMVYCHQPIMNYIIENTKPLSKGISNKIVMMVGFACFIWTGFSLLIYQLNIHEFLATEEINDWMLAVYKKCDNQSTLYSIDSPFVLQNICFISSQQIWVIFGFIYGIKIANGIYIENQFNMSYSKLIWYKKFLRILILIILFLVLGILAEIEIENVYVSFWQVLLVSFMGGLIITFIYSKILSCLKMSVEGDFLEIPETLTIFDSLKQEPVTC